MTELVYMILGVIFDLINIRVVFIIIGITIAICAVIGLVIMKRREEVKVEIN